MHSRNFVLILLFKKKKKSRQEKRRHYLFTSKKVQINFNISSLTDRNLKRTIFFGSRVYGIKVSCNWCEGTHGERRERHTPVFRMQTA